MLKGTARKFPQSTTCAPYKVVNLYSYGVPEREYLYWRFLVHQNGMCCLLYQHAQTECRIVERKMDMIRAIQNESV
eukprot:scaffold107426_cov27-Prasinocladus_malaysianus.AAC.1